MIKNKISLMFESNIGVFLIENEDDREDRIFLSIETKERENLRLADYCSINDAFVAVSHQQTGYKEWDAMAPMDLPYGVHDIVCWKRK